MWTCPKCKEIIEDQFDSCWKCAGDTCPETPTHDLVWLYPALSLASSMGFSSVMFLCFNPIPHHSDPYFSLGGATLGVAMSAVAILAFLSCPWRHWVAKIVTLVSMIGSLSLGIAAFGSFAMHVFGGIN